MAEGMGGVSSSNMVRLGQGPFYGLDSKWHSRLCIHLGKLSPPRRLEPFLLPTGNRSWPIHEGMSLEDNAWEIAQAKAKKEGVVTAKVCKIMGKIKFVHLTDSFSILDVPQSLQGEGSIIWAMPSGAVQK